VKENILKCLGNNIRSLRAMQGFSQESFAKHAGIDRSYMGAIERGQRNICMHNVEKIALALKINIYELFIVRTDNNDTERNT
jgi:transcriptional regulator with XRE-family HTH domain